MSNTLHTARQRHTQSSYHNKMETCEFGAEPKKTTNAGWLWNERPSNNNKTFPGSVVFFSRRSVRSMFAQYHFGLFICVVPEAVPVRRISPHNQRTVTASTHTSNTVSPFRLFTKVWMKFGVLEDQKKVCVYKTNICRGYAFNLLDIFCYSRFKCDELYFQVLFFFINFYDYDYERKCELWVSMMRNGNGYVADKLFI